MEVDIDINIILKITNIILIDQFVIRKESIRDTIYIYLF